MPKFTQIPDGQALFIVPSNIQAAISGAVRAAQHNTGLITLTYEDGATESRSCTQDIESFDSYFAIVGYVQAGRNGN